ARTDEVWNEILGVNLEGTFFCCRAAASELKKAGGAIVNVASIAAHRASGSSSADAGSKAGVVRRTRALAIALAPEVRVNSVSPGLVSSRWFSKSFGDEAAAAQEDAFAKATPVRKIASPDDVAQAVIALLETDVITGHDLVIDGGKNVLYQPLAGGYFLAVGGELTFGLAPPTGCPYIVAWPRGKRSRGQEQGRKAMYPLPRGDPSGSLLFRQSIAGHDVTLHHHERRAAPPEADGRHAQDQSRAFDRHAVSQRGGNGRDLHPQSAGGDRQARPCGGDHHRRQRQHRRLEDGRPGAWRARGRRHATGLRQRLDRWHRRGARQLRDHRRRG